MRTLLETPHGSRLYGLHHKHSDFDRFMVVEDNPTKKIRYAAQTVTGTHDLVVCDLSTFILYASRGVPQYLEAMWTPCPTVDRIPDLRMSFNPNYYQTLDTYQRTADNFYLKGTDQGSDKLLRHAYRLVLNILDYRIEGIFNPRMTHDQVRRISEMVQEGRHPDTYLDR